MGHPVHAEHPPYQKHYFNDMQQQSQATLFGMWLFLVQEIMFFGGLFAAYAVYRYLYPEAYLVGAATQNLKLGILNTFVLIGSSYTVVLMVAAARKSNKNAMTLWMVLTMALGGVFLGVKVIEYSAKWEHRLVPGKYFDFSYYMRHHWHEIAGGSHGDAGAAHAAGPAGEKAAHAAEAHAAPAHGDAAHAADHHHEPRRYDDMATRGTDPKVPKGIMLYYSLYFAMTGMHALHMIIGFGIAIWLLIDIRKGRFTESFYPHIEYFGLYWHFVDIVWIFLFPLLYLI
jgi:cytochrome c oxidase subunit III